MKFQDHKKQEELAKKYKLGWERANQLFSSFEKNKTKLTKKVA